MAFGEWWGRTRGEGGWGRKERAEVEGALVPARERLMFMFMFMRDCSRDMDMASLPCGALDAMGGTGRATVS